MKHLFSSILFCVAGCLHLFSPVQSFGAQTVATISQPYQFNPKPGSREWDNLQDIVERTAACEIPHDLARRMTTQALVETCMNYPLLAAVLLYTDPQHGLNITRQNFFGFKEIETRDDFDSTIVAQYLKVLGNRNDPKYHTKIAFLNEYLRSAPIRRLLSLESKKKIVQESIVEVVRMASSEADLTSEQVHLLRVAVPLLIEDKVPLGRVQVAASEILVAFSERRSVNAEELVGEVVGLAARALKD